MDREQPDLFLGAQDDPGLLARRIERNSFVARIWKYEKVILFILGFLVVGIVSFSLGVEKGRRENKPVFNLPAPVREQVSLPKQSINMPIIEKEPEKAPRIEPLATAVKGEYCIQVATFNTRNYAQKEVETLLKKGFRAFVITKGKHFVVCVGNFSDKLSAQPVLSELGRYYKGCYIRRI